MGQEDGATKEGYAFNLTELDKWTLLQTDEEFQRHDWEDLKRIVGAHDLTAFKRLPSQLKKYLHWSAEIKAQYGSVSHYVLLKRLPSAWGQPPFQPASNIPFAEPSDYQVLLNDWPYATEPGITHMVVWSRTIIPLDAETGFMTADSKALVEGFVKRYFVDKIGTGGEDQVLWFKNWAALQSVGALEHFHVLVRDVNDDMLESWTGERPRREG